MVRNKNLMDQIKNLDCNQIKIFINLEIIGEEKLYIFFLLVEPLGATIISNPNFYYIIYKYIYIYIYIYKLEKAMS